MQRVASRELRNETRRVLELAEAGEEVEITVDGRPVARLSARPSRRPWIPTSQLAAILEGAQADPGLAAELRSMNPGSTDDL